MKNSRNSIVIIQSQYTKGKADNVPVVMTSRDVAERNQRANNYNGWKSNKIRTNIEEQKHSGWTQRLNEIRTFAEGRNHNQ